MDTTTAGAALRGDNGEGDMDFGELEYDLTVSGTDLGRYFQAARRTDLPYLVVTAQAVRAWKRREPAIFARFSHWLAAQGKQLIEV